MKNLFFLLLIIPLSMFAQKQAVLVENGKAYFNWHPSAGGGSWVFVDEIVVR